MTVDSIFAQALAKSTPAERTAYLDEACAHDLAMRQRVETLLQSHEAAGNFLGKPAIQCAAEEWAGPAWAGDTQAEAPGDDGDAAPLDFLAPSDKPDSLGRLGHYEVLEVIGRGGMGIVLRALDEKLHRVVAIKVMAAQLATNATARKRFAREAQAQAAVSHDHIVTIHAVEEANGLPYLVMQYIAGMSLQERLDKSGSLQLHEILRIGMQTASGLAAAHAQGLVHRDIKPANILLENGVERVKVTDFGLARAATEASLTQSGVVAGTPQYMSPEQAEGKAIDQRTDLFSLGSVLYTMCTGRAPFRASGTMAVLKRVCESTPAPIRDTNAEIPDWMVAIIDKLHAKDPAQRYQSATEVAELLGRHLAHVQHPSVASAPFSPLGRGPARERQPFALPIRRLAVAAAVLLLCVVTGLSLTEATGVTSLRATVIRIFTPEGTLVVETDDPAVKVTIEGDGGLVIAGAGLQEVRLKPGSYKVQAAKDGKPVRLDQELVTITRGDKQVVRVRLEGDAATAKIAAKGETGAFVLLGGKSVAERKFDTLAEAVQGASDGDTIEVRGNGPFVCSSIKITQALTIRAGEGFRPVLKLNPNLRTDAPLVLEGLELQRLGQEPRNGGFEESLVYVSSGTDSLHVANCRFQAAGDPDHHDLRRPCVASVSSRCVVRNCAFLSPSSFNLFWWCRTGCSKLCVVDNCLLAGERNLEFGGYTGEQDHDFSVRLTRSTLLCADLGTVRMHAHQSLIWPAEKNVKPIRVDASANIFDTRSLFVIFDHSPRRQEAPSTRGKWFEAQLRRVLTWRDRLNLYAPGGSSVTTYTPDPTGWGEPMRVVAQNLADWKRFWGPPDGDAIEGPIRYQGGDLLGKLRDNPEKLTPDDFRLRPDSAGYKAGKDGKDLGADMDLVGPGQPYERWKKTPEYQQWLKDTKRVTKAEPKAESKAFAVLTGKGIEVRKFDTLAEAVQGANDGDTIEVRGNGPFVTEPIKLGKTALTIRAGEGFRPVIKLSPEGLQADAPLLETEATLVLEGLELQRMSQDRREGQPWQVVLTASKDLHVANCRFLMRKTDFCIHNNNSPVSELRNCEFLNADNCGSAMVSLDVHESDRRLVIDNCLLTDFTRVNTHEQYKAKGAFVQLTRNTFRMTHGAFKFYHMFDKEPSPKDLDPRAKLLNIETSGNIFDASVVFQFEQDPPDKRLPAPEAESYLAHKIGWVGERSLYAVDSPFFLWDGILDPTRPVKNLVDWRRFWATAEANSIEGRVKYQGGDLLTKLAATPEQLTPDDFRLRPDSAGYKAGKDGKDLGADVDLVGPGPAYARWQKTPEYQQWLRDSGQVKK